MIGFPTHKSRCGCPRYFVVRKTTKTTVIPKVFSATYDNIMSYIARTAFLVVQVQESACRSRPHPAQQRREYRRRKYKQNSPYTVVLRIPAALPNLVASSLIWHASSRVGARTTTYGPDPIRGLHPPGLLSNAWNAGSKKPSVFPDPVLATEMMSRPLRAMGHDLGRLGRGGEGRGAIRARGSARYVPFGGGTVVRRYECLSGYI